MACRLLALIVCPVAMVGGQNSEGGVCGPGWTSVPVVGRPYLSWSLVAGGGSYPGSAHLSAVQVSGADRVIWSHLPTLPAEARLTVCTQTAAGAESRRTHDVSLPSVHATELRKGGSITATLAIDAERCGATIVHVQASIDRLHTLRVASSVGGVSVVALCSDGIDNDGDGLADDVDPGCDNPRGGSEHSDNAAPTSLTWEWASAANGPEFLKELRWTDKATQKTVPVVRDEPSAQVASGCRWWPHGGNCSHWLQSYSNNSARETQDWAWKIVVPDGHGGGPQFLEQESAITKRLLHSNGTSAVYESVSKRLRLQDVYSLRGDTMFVSISAKSLMNNTVRATFLTPFGSLQLGPAALPEAHSGNRELWHLGNKRAGSLDRNWSYVEACVYPYDGAAPMPSRACFSPASAMGDADHFSAGIQLLTPISPDDPSALHAYMDVPANPRTPTSTSTLTLVLKPGETRTFVFALKVAPPVGAGLPRSRVLAAMASVVNPYIKLFAAVWGRQPQYCPTPSTSYEDAINYGLNRHPICSQRYPPNNPISQMQNCNPWGNDTECDCWWKNGTKMYSVLNIDTLRRGESDKGSVMKDFGAPYHISWRPGVQSSHLTIPNRHMQCEFNPNSDVPPTYNTNLKFAATFANVAVFFPILMVKRYCTEQVMDPHQDVFWNETIWDNLTAAARQGGFSLGWGLRSTEEILTAENRSSTIVLDPTQPSGYRIIPGICVNFEGFYNDSVGNATSPDSDGRGVQWGNLIGPQTDRFVARVKTLVGRGIRAFYLDSHIAPGRFDAVLQIRRFFGAEGLGRQLFIFRESTNDVDILAMGQMPWYAYGDVVNEHGQESSPAWQPVFIADHSHWARMLVPDGEVVFGQLADPPPSCGNVSAFGDPLHGPIADLQQHRGNTFILATISTLPKLAMSEHLKAGVCAVMTKSWENYQARMASYGRAMGCREFPRPLCSSKVP